MDSGLDKAKQEIPLTTKELWFLYCCNGGAASLMELEAYLHGVLEMDPHEHDQIAYCLNEALMVRGEQPRLDYWRGEHDLAVTKRLHASEIAQRIWIERARLAQ